MNEKEEIFRGHLDECLSYLLNLLHSRSPDLLISQYRAKLRHLAEFCNVDPTIAYEWLRNTQVLPLAPRRFKLMAFLDLMGFKVIEFERMPTYSRNGVEIISFSSMSIEEIWKALLFSKSSHLYASIMGNENINSERQEKMWELWKTLRTEIEEKKLQLQSSHILPLLSEINTETQRKFTRANAPLCNTVSTTKPEESNALASQIRDLGLIIKSSSIDSLTASLTGCTQDILSLTAHLNYICSRLYTQEQKGEAYERKGICSGGG